MPEAFESPGADRGADRRPGACLRRGRGLFAAFRFPGEGHRPALVAGRAVGLVLHDGNGLEERFHARVGVVLVEVDRLVLVDGQREAVGGANCCPVVLASCCRPAGTRGIFPESRQDDNRTKRQQIAPAAGGFEGMGKIAPAAGEPVAGASTRARAGQAGKRRATA